MENNKYYTPSIEEFYVGFEYEIFEDFDIEPEKSWHKCIYGKNGTDPEQLDYVYSGNLDKIRVKYLDKEDIGSLGWETLYHNYQFSFKDYVLDISKIYNELYYVIMNDSWDREILFRGTIKNKSELKKVMQMIGINI